MILSIWCNLYETFIVARNMTTFVAVINLPCILWYLSIKAVHVRLKALRLNYLNRYIFGKVNILVKSAELFSHWWIPSIQFCTVFQFGKWNVKPFHYSCIILLCVESNCLTTTNPNFLWLYCVHQIKPKDDEIVDK